VAERSALEYCMAPAPRLALVIPIAAPEYRGTTPALPSGIRLTIITADDEAGAGYRSCINRSLHFLIKRDAPIDSAHLDRIRDWTICPAYDPRP
jgi:hypothetical protein